VSVRVPFERSEEARALMLELAPEGFEERERGTELELAAYTDAFGGSRIARAFGAAREDDVPADWGERWRTFHRPARAGPFWIGPPWEAAPHDAIAIVIEPGLAFGTGAHATTRLCLELLAELPRGSLLDAGCGSGVLAVGAAKLGFRPVCAIDDDPFAVQTTLANAAANDVAVDTRQLDVTSGELPGTELAVANIALATVEALAGRLPARELVSSGYLERDLPRLRDWTHVERRTLDGWAADRFRRDRKTLHTIPEWRRSAFASSAARSPTPMLRTSVSVCSPTGTPRSGRARTSGS
jgi:ribosomal protein L11 methyltransferase